MNESLKFTIQNELQLRFLTPDDVPEIKCLCADWFPIDYPETWFQDITSADRFYALAATHNTRIIGMVVAEVKQRSRMNMEDGDILASTFSNCHAAYILSLGVARDYRRCGIASLLLDNLLSYATSPEKLSCKVVYLHVLCTNIEAIRFYERRNFKKHGFLPYYYSIKNKPRDGYSYVLYINGGRPPWTIILFEGVQAGGDFLLSLFFPTNHDEKRLWSGIQVTNGYYGRRRYHHSYQLMLYGILV